MAAHLSLGSLMKAQVTKIFQGIDKLKTRSNIYNIEMTFASPDAEQPIPLSREIDTVRITQDFINNFTDKIVANLTVDKSTCQWLYYYRNNLWCTLSFTRYDQNAATQQYRAPMYEYKYRCLLITNADPDKAIPASSTQPDEREPTDRNLAFFSVKVELIDDGVYSARKKRITSIFRNTDMKSVLNYSISHFGFKKAVVVNPDNDNKYINFVIPPDFGITDIMSFLQNGAGMGVYKNGFCSYITQGCWYVFPRYGDPICKRAIHLYKVNNDSYAGVPVLNWNEALSDGDVTTHIIIDSEVAEKNWSHVGVENAINAANIQLNELIVDHCRSVKKDLEFEMENRIINEARVPTDAMNKDEVVNIEFRPSRNNIYSIMSELGAFQVTTVQFNWNMAEPFIFHPGTVVKYHYEHRAGKNVVIRTLTGKTEYVEYTYTKDKSKPQLALFTGSANTVVACSNELIRQDGTF